MHVPTPTRSSIAFRKWPASDSAADPPSTEQVVQLATDLTKSIPPPPGSVTTIEHAQLVIDAKVVPVRGFLTAWPQNPTEISGCAGALGRLRIDEDTYKQLPNEVRERNAEAQRVVAAWTPLHQFHLKVQDFRALGPAQQSARSRQKP